MKTIIIGLGNPILSDDGVGIKVARELISLRITHRSLRDVHITEVYAGGIRLMDEMVGYDRAVIIDAMATQDNMPGTIRSLSFSDLISTRNMVCAHDMNLPTALEMGKALGLRLPSDIRILGVEAADVENFGEELTEEVKKAVPVVVEKVVHELTRG